MELSQTTTTTEKSSTTSEPRPIQFSTATSSSNHSSRRSNHSSSAKLMNTSHSIDSSSSLTTNLLEINEDCHQMDLFGGSGNLSHSKSLIHDSQYDDEDDYVSGNKNNEGNESSKENLSNRSPTKKSNMTKLKHGEFIRIVPASIFTAAAAENQTTKKKQQLTSKTIIYDNNFTNISDKKTNQSKPNQHQQQQQQPTSSQHSINSYYLQSSEFKSKSCERINGMTPPTTLQSSVNKSDKTSNNNTNSTSQLAFIDDQDQCSSNNSNDNNFDCQNKKLNYSKSLKLVQPSGKSTQYVGSKEKSSCGVSDCKGGGGQNFNDRTNLIANVKPSLVSVNTKFGNGGGGGIGNVTNEPSWKELAFRKHTAWYMFYLIRGVVSIEHF